MKSTPPIMLRLLRWIGVVAARQDAAAEAAMADGASEPGPERAEDLESGLALLALICGLVLVLIVALAIP
jgi:hypothetical protein